MAGLLMAAVCGAAVSQTVDCSAKALEHSLKDLKQVPAMVGCQYDPVDLILKRSEPQIEKDVVPGSEPAGQIVKQSPGPEVRFQARMMIVLQVSDGSIVASKPGNGVPEADVSVRGTVDTPGPYRPGQAVKFSIYVKNLGPAVATGVVVTQVPTNMTIQSVGGGSGCTQFPCSSVDLIPDSTTTMWMTGVIAGEGDFSSLVRASFRGRDLNPSNNVAVLGASTEITPPPPQEYVPPPKSTEKTQSADVSVTGSVQARDAPQPGDAVSFSIEVKNAGPGVATGIRVTESPINLKMQQVGGGVCMTFPCTIRQLGAGASAWIYVNGEIVQAGKFGVVVRAVPRGADSNSQNNQIQIGGDAEPAQSWVVWIWGGVVAGLVIVIAVVAPKVRRAWWKRRLAVSAAIDQGRIAGTCGPVSFAAPTVRLQARMEPGPAAADGRVPVVRTEVLND